MQTLKDATLVITGGTGSFGSTMVKALLSRGLREIRVFSRDEAKQDALRNEVSDTRVKFYIGDTRDMSSVSNVMKGSDAVFHAAAMKQVPSAEFFPIEAVKTNVLGSANVLRAAVECEVKSVVCLSTDKAVYPINAMGMTKALMEKTAQAIARDSQGSKTTISMTRYGNVMYSRGSVIPRFIDQILTGNPVTITDGKMTRFMMSLAESVELVEYAFRNADSGDLFVKKSPGSTIATLVDALAELFESRSAIQEIGFRHGEKLYESLLSAEERERAIDLGEFYRVPMDSRDLNYAPYFHEGKGRSEVLEPYTSHNTHRLSVTELKELLITIPEIKAKIEAK